jgi:8-oxo-dGTP pyrophosphatase MutT (NUDIX family)
MLLYYAADSPDVSPEQVAEEGVRAAPGEVLALHTDLDDVPGGGERPVFVVDGDALPEPERATARVVEVWEVPPAAIRNAAPYRPPELIQAGGGYVARAVNGADGAPEEDVAVLLIHRKGCWDLPKGKLDPGETVAECARREVCEEVGISTVEMLRPLGTTQHGYVEDRRDPEVYAVKTTHWYLMQTPERTFEPERREGIRRVAWARWSVARRHVGYDTLTRHMDRIEADVRSVFG